MDKSKHILVAEDSDADFFLLERAFKLAGLSHRLARVRNGAQVMKYLNGEPPFQDRTTSPRPDLLILDGNMPQVSGLEVLTSLRAQGNPLPVVMLSGSGHPDGIEAALALGAVEYLEKPDSPPELTLLVQTIHHRWLTKPPTA